MLRHFNTKSNFLRTDWIQYIPTEPLSTRPVVERPLSNERVWEPRGGEIPIVETHWVENSDVFMGDVIDVPVSEEAPLELTEKIAIINKVQRDSQKFIINGVQRDSLIDVDWASLDAQLESDISETLEVQLSRKIQWNYQADEYLAQSLSTLEADLQDFTEFYRERESFFDGTAWNENLCFSQASQQEQIEAFFAELRQDSKPPTLFVMAPRPTNANGPLRGGGGHWNNGGGGDWNNGGGGDDSNWHNGGGGDFDGGDPRWNYVGFILFGGAIVIIGKIIGQIIVDNGYTIIKKNLDKLLSSTKKQIDDVKTKNTLHLRRSLPSLLPVLASGPALVVLSYLFHPQRLRQLVECLAEIGAILAQQIGRLLLQALPPQLREAAQRLGHFIEIVGVQLRRFVDQVVVPVALYGRALGLLLVKVYFLLKLASLGMELYKVCGKAVPEAVVTQAHQIAEALSGAGEVSIVLFVENFLKSVSLLVVGLIPVSQDVPKFVRLLGRGCIVSFVVSTNGRFFVQKVASGLLSYPIVVSLCGCIAGRWAMIVLTVNIARGDTTLRRYSVPFIALLYVLRVYELAMTATPNFLPN